MRTKATVTLSLLLPLSAWGATLDVSGACPGAVTLAGGGFSSGEQVALVSAAGPGVAITPAGSCVGTELGLADDGLRLRRLLTADAAGGVVLTPTLSAGACSSSVQLLGLWGCASSPAMPLTPGIETLFTITADNAYESFVDGVPLTGIHAAVWPYVDDLSLDLAPGDHVWAIKVTDWGGAGGLTATVGVEGGASYGTGGGSFLLTTEDPGEDWVLPGYDDGAWRLPELADSDPWGLDIAGAEWVWSTADVDDSDKLVWFRLNFTL
jgi:hypothetical protein